MTDPLQHRISALMERVERCRRSPLSFQLNEAWSMVYELLGIVADLAAEVRRGEEAHHE